MSESTSLLTPSLSLQISLSLIRPSAPKPLLQALLLGNLTQDHMGQTLGENGDILVKILHLELQTPLYDSVFNSHLQGVGHDLLVFPQAQSSQNCGGWGW